MSFNLAHHPNWKLNGFSFDNKFLFEWVSSASNVSFNNNKAMRSRGSSLELQVCKKATRFYLFRERPKK